MIRLDTIANEELRHRVRRLIRRCRQPVILDSDVHLRAWAKRTEKDLPGLDDAAIVRAAAFGELVSEAERESLLVEPVAGTPWTILRLPAAATEGEAATPAPRKKRRSR